MNRLITAAAIAACLVLSIVAARAEDDSMGMFKALIQYSTPATGDMGGMSAPEIFSAEHYPLLPQPGQKVTVKAQVRTYGSLVPYKITKVGIEYWKKGGEKTSSPMKAEDAAAGIFSFELPAFSEGDEVFYTINAEDDWGNKAVEIEPGAPMKEVMSDAAESGIDPAMDITKIYAGGGDSDRLRLCMELTQKAKRMAGNDLAAYALVIFSNDARFKPELTENEFTSGWMGAYVPNFMIKDLVPANELFDALNPSKKRKKRADFSEKDNRFCFTFQPETVRGDYYLGLKVVGATIAVSVSPMAAKPTDTTHAVMIYPGAHSFRVVSLPLK